MDQKISLSTFSNCDLALTKQADFCFPEISRQYSRVPRHGDFPGDKVVKNPPASAGDTGSSPGPGSFPHAMEQLSLCTTTTEPAL